MKRITLAALSILTVVGFASAPAYGGGAWPLPTKLQVDVSPFFGLGGTTDPGQLVELTVRSPGGAIKAVDRLVSDGASGNFEFSSSPFASSFYPGDRLTFVLADNATYTYSAVFPRLRLTGFNLATGTIFGRVTPRQARVMFGILGQRVVADPITVATVANPTWVSPAPGKRTAADGRFSVKPAMSSPEWAGTFRRGDQYEMEVSVPLVPGDPNFLLRAQETGRVPGLPQVVRDTTLAIVTGSLFQNYRARLESRSGRLKGTAAASVGFFGPMGILDFRKGDGRPGVIASGDTIRVAGLGGFSTVVPRLRGVIDPVANSATIFGPPKRFVQVSFNLYDDTGGDLPGPAPVWVRTNAAGKAVVGPGGFTLRAGDRVTLVHMDAAGIVWVAEDQALP